MFEKVENINPLTACSDGGSSSHFTILAVHVVCARTRIVAQPIYNQGLRLRECQPNSVVLDAVGAALENLFQR